MLTTEVIDTEDGIARLASEWIGLWQEFGQTPFQLPQWLLAWWRCFGTDRPQIATAREGSALVGVLPLYLLHETACVKLLPIGIGLSDYCDALTLPGRSDIGPALLGAIAGVPEWQECHLPDLPPDAALCNPPAPPGWREERIAAVPCPVLTLPASVEDLKTAVPRKTLRDVHQARRRAAACGSVRIEQIGGDTLDAAMVDFFRLHQERWQSRGESGVCADPAVQRFHREAARAMLRAGLLRLYRLHIGDAVAAVYYGLLHRRRAYAYLGGFDPDLPRLSPGAQIIAHAIEEAIREGAAEFHFLRGGEAYKYAWGAADRWNTARTFRR